MRKLFFVLIFLNSFVCFSQILDPGNLVTIEIIGNTQADEGSTEEYLVRYSINGLFPSGQTPNFVRNITKGTEVSFTPSILGLNAYDLVVLWDCKPIGNGNIGIQETVTASSASLNVELSSYANAPSGGTLSWFCNNISNGYQNLIFGETPNPVSVACTKYCKNAYQFQYQWQIRIGGTPANPIFIDIAGATNDVYYPPTYNTINTSVYRRRTSFDIGVVPYIFYSQVAVVSFYAPLQSGTVNTTNQFLYVNSFPSITQTPATDGACPGTGYLYTWEKLGAADFTWYPIGNAEEFPIDFIITESTNIRRKVTCGNEVMYTNVVQLYVTTQLAPGTITANTTLPINYGTIPSVSQTPATGGLCLATNYVYTWERSIDNQAWQVFGSGEQYPPTAFIAGNTRYRRKIICAGEELYSNIISFTMAPYVSPNAENLNYVRVNDITIPNINTWIDADYLATGGKIQSTTYLDGLGRPIQKVIKQGGLKQSIIDLDPNDLANYQDLVTIQEYDQLGRMDKSFLPFATQTSVGFYKTNAHNEQNVFNNTKYNEPTNSQFTSAQTLYDGSPFNRITNIKLPGNAWNTNTAYKGISSDYGLYKSPETVRVWDIGYNTGDVPTTSSIYLDYKLSKSIIKDEKDKLIIEYKDFSGNLILRKVQEKEGIDIDMNGYRGWLCTYYVYDDFNRLRYTITPKAVANMDITGNWSVDVNTKEGLCFYQEYDVKDRIVVKHAPDGGEVWLVYDNRDRLVLSQDANQRNRTALVPAKPNQWSFSLYDDNDRILGTGLINDSRNRVAIQTMVDNLSINSQNKTIQVYTGAFENVVAYNPVVGKIGGVEVCQPCINTTINAINYYDKYNATSKAFVPINSTDFAPLTIPNNQPAAMAVKSLRVMGFVTTTKIRVLDANYDNGIVTDDRFLISTSYIDEKGRTIQGHAENIKAGTDVVSMMYDFAGKVLSTNSKHNVPSGLFDNTITITKNEYDLLGREKNTFKLYTKTPTDISNLSKYKKLNEVSLDEFGRVKTKSVGNSTNPSTPTAPLDITDYTYNIQGWLTGMNKEYALSGQASFAMNYQFARHFGLYLGYENADGKLSGSTQSQWNGNIMGTIWRSQGDNTPRKYEYDYDNLNRFIAAKFNQKEKPLDSEAWANNKVDLSVYVSGYDPNGNILGMKQTGIVPGTMGGVVIDDLQYTYYDNSNKLKSVKDLAFGGNQALNGKQGDFKDFAISNNSVDADYDYDYNGNLLFDKNKSIINNNSNVTDILPTAGIISNFLNLPEKITVKGKSTTEYVYNAAGTKLSKKVTLLTASPPAPITTFYLGEFIYEDNDLQFILNEEGKLRIVDPIAAWSAPSGAVNYLSVAGNVELINSGSIHKWGVWDYFIKDNLSNTRMVLTEEEHIQQMLCSMEDNNPNVKLDEEQTFGQTGAANEVNLTRYDRVASGWPASNNSSDKVSRLINQVSSGGATKSIGPNGLLKVMAGDELLANVKYFYQNLGTNATNTNILNNIVGGFINAITSSTTATGIVKDNFAAISNTNTAGSSPLNTYISNQPNPLQNTSPRAYLNMIFFDEQFRYVGESSLAKMVDETTPGIPKIDNLILNRKATKNGYVYVYLSNESINIPVYFDNLLINHTRGDIVEDNSYYAYGLKIEGISAKAALKPKIKYGYQGNYSELDDESRYNEFALRTYDPQIGRWIQADPKIVQPGIYNGMSDNPINVVDPDGGGPDGPGSKTDWFRNARGNTFWSSSTAQVICNGGEEYFNIGKSFTEILAGNTDYFLEWGAGGVATKMLYSDIFDDLLDDGEGTVKKFVDISKKVRARSFDYKENDNAFWKSTTFMANVFSKLVNGTVGTADAIVNLPHTIEQVDLTARKGYDYVTTTTAAEKRNDFANALKNPHTYESIVALGAGLGVAKTGVFGSGKITGAVETVAVEGEGAAIGTIAAEATEVTVHGNSLLSTKPTWGYKLFSNDGTFLKNGITNKPIPEGRYTKGFMSGKYMEATPFPNRLAAYQWEFGQNQILRGPLNFNMH